VRPGPSAVTGSIAPMSAFSSWGMTDDGRMGVTVVGNGVDVYSAAGNADNAYATLNGTSMAAPNVTGTMTQVIQHLQAKRNTATVPLSATSKALAVHTADDLYATGPDYQSGYGVLNGLAAVEYVDAVHAPAPTSFIFEEVNDGSVWSANFLTLGNNFKATLVWTDLAGAGNTGGLDDATSALVNDLDLLIEVLDIQGNVTSTHYPWSLDPANPGNAALQDQANRRDNVEQVLMSPFLAGLEFRVSVSRFAGAGNQAFSLLVEGGTLVPEPTVLAALASLAAMSLRRMRRR
jgi:hypothetical protein